MIGILLSVANIASPASFDCDKARTNVELLICSDEELSELDDLLAADYRRALELAIESDDRNRDSLQSESPKWAETQTRVQQREWLHYERNSCKTVVCLIAEYHARVPDYLKPEKFRNQSKLFGKIPYETSIPSHVPGYYIRKVDLAFWGRDAQSFEIEGEVEDFLYITDVGDGKAKIEIELTFFNAHGCKVGGEGKWKENHIELLKESKIKDEHCRLRIYTDGKGALLRDPDGYCKRKFCGMRGLLDGIQLRIPPE